MKHTDINKIKYLLSIIFDGDDKKIKQELNIIENEVVRDVEFGNEYAYYSTKYDGNNFKPYAVRYHKDNEIFNKHCDSTDDLFKIGTLKLFVE